MTWFEEIPAAKGENLDRIALTFDLKRKRKFFLKESDDGLRRRIYSFLCETPFSATHKDLMKKIFWRFYRWAPFYGVNRVTVGKFYYNALIQGNEYVKLPFVNVWWRKT